MKITKLLLLLATLSLTGCSINTETNNNNENNPSNNGGENNNQQGGDNGNQNQGGDNNGNNNNNQGGNNGGENTTPVEARMQDTPILHCWNWSMTNISNNLQNIKDAGFKTIQLSPMQPQKDYYSGGDSVQNGWWKLYQPLGFSVATRDHQIGTKSELTSMCAKAKSLGIDVIVDVVANHLANIRDEEQESDGTPKVNPAVRQYEEYIYDHRNDSENPTFHHNKYAAGSGSVTQYYSWGQLPDLNTGHAKVQERVTSLLKEYIDCGVSGFRFDAAKHIETPEDPQYPSDFWKNVLGNTTTYAKNKGLKDPYYYGEILSQPDGGREFELYTKYMATIDSRQGSAVLAAVKDKNLDKISEKYPTRVQPSKLVLWAESHDTFANGDGESKDVSQDIINKAYVIQASRKDAASLYLARPNRMSDTLGSVGSTSYKNAEIKAANNFHNEFIGKSENVSVNNNCFVNVRGGQGAVIVNINNSSSSNVKISASGLANGTYTDLVNNRKYTVSNNEVTVNFTNGVCILVNDSKVSEVPPTLSLSATNEVYTSTTNVTVNASGATSLSYSINGGAAQTFTGNSIALPSSLANGLVTVTVVATNQYGSTTKTITLIKTTSLVNKSLVIYNADATYAYYVWAWQTSNDSKWYSPTVEGNIIGFDLGNAKNFIVVKFAKGTSAPDWVSKINQTEDLILDKQVYNYNELPIKSN